MEKEIYDIVKPMTLSEIITVIVLVLNVIALCVVAYQTYLTRNSLKTAKESIDETRKARQLEILPRANFVICVTGNLEKWLEDLNEIIGKLEKAVPQRDQDVLRDLSKQGLKSPKNLIDRFMYEHAPNWLSVIWVTGAQYYYDCKAPMCDLCNNEREIPHNLSLGSDLLNLCKESAYHISELLAYVNRIVPNSYLQSPASLSDEDFLTD